MSKNVFKLNEISIFSQINKDTLDKLNEICFIRKSKAKKYKIIGLVAIICVLGISINYFNKKYIYS